MTDDVPLRSARVPLLPILTVNFIGTLGFSIVLPFLVFLVTRWGGNALVYGLLGATYSAFQLFGAPVLGRWSDTRGRRNVLLLSQIGTLLSWAIFLAAFFLPIAPLASIDSTALGSFTLTLPLLVLFLARALDGLTGGNISVANAYLADITTGRGPEPRTSGSMGVSVEPRVHSSGRPMAGPARGIRAPGARSVPVLGATGHLDRRARFSSRVSCPSPIRAPCAEDPEGAERAQACFGPDRTDCVELDPPELRLGVARGDPAPSRAWASCFCDSTSWSCWDSTSSTSRSRCTPSRRCGGPRSPSACTSPC